MAKITKEMMEQVQPAITARPALTIRLFEGLSGLTDLDISTLDITGATSLMSMFSRLPRLNELVIPSNFDTSNITSMSGSGRDQATVIKQLVDNYFVPQKNISKVCRINDDLEFACDLILNSKYKT